MPPSPGLSVVGPEILTNHVVVDGVVGVGVTDGVGVGVADADVETEGDAAPAALGDAWLLLSDDKQPVIDNEATITSTIIANNFFSIHVFPQRKNESKA